MEIPSLDIPVPMVRAELDAYLRDAREPDSQGLPTRCPPWTVHDLTAHLAETFARFRRLLAQGRAGDMTPPFRPADLHHHNLERVAAFQGDPVVVLEREAAGFLDEVGDPDELVAHQLGPIPMRLQLGFALSELAIHHDDLAHAHYRAYDPPVETVTLLAALWDGLRGLPIPEPDDTDWTRILRATGR
jgi:uncharacterized protein (TIGR03083 family)